jgi:hypothetical protein
MLWTPEAHETLTERPWDEAWVRDRIELIAEGAERAVGPDGFWKMHPLDADEEGTVIRCGLYMGAAGIVWGLHALGRDHPGLVAGLLDSYHREPDWPGVVPGYLMGEAGIALVAHQLDPSPAWADAVERALLENVGNPTNELLWGDPGTMLAAHAIYRRTGEGRFAEVYRAGAAELESHWEYDEDLVAWLWTQDMYDDLARYVGAGHGVAGNVLAFVVGRELLADDQMDVVEQRAVVTAQAFAVREDGLANWTPLAGRELQIRDSIRTQWCHGAPGIVASLAGVATGDDEFTGLLLEGGELTWRAGPLAKGAGICHGTAGNGLAFLALHARTGDERWLERARAFAVHALEQVDREHERYGAMRHSLFTGDIGVAVMAQSCIEARPGVPALDWV